MPGPLVLAGCGKMGGALLAGWIARGTAAADVVVVEPDDGARAQVQDRLGIAALADADALAADIRPATVVFAVKPQAMDAVAPAYRRFAGPGCVFLSIAAGRTIAGFEAALGTDAAIVRAMPNTPAQIGRGITVACPNAGAGEAEITRCDALLAAVGEVAWIDDEGLMDAVTAVSGSGPAYVFLLCECLAQAGAAAGLAPNLSERLARATVAGSGELLARADEPASRLREDVTSPGGTTAAALDVLMAADGLRALLTEAVARAAERSRALAG